MALASCLAAVALGACGGDDSSADPGAADPASELTVEQATAELNGAPPELAAIRSEANQLLAGGVEAFQARLAELEGTPVVINKWASWCGPCRFEFPFFQNQSVERAGDVAFLGINSEDSEDAAQTFLETLPVPYPSYSDPDSEIADSLDVGREFPSTIFIDAAGEVVFTKRGGYASEAELAADIDRYAG